MLMSITEPTPRAAATALAALEILWQDAAAACLPEGDPDGALSAGPLRAGLSAIAEIEALGRGVTARQVGIAELVALADDPPAGIELGGSARATFAVVDLARRSVAEGLVHPQLV